MDTRSHEVSIEIDAPVEAVWRALTEAGEIQRWFAPVVKVTPGVGGSMFASWGEGMEGTQVIEVWEPNRHLRLTQEREFTYGCMGEGAAQVAPVRLVVDYFLEAQGGKTLLRLVNSGFGSGAEWDGEYEGTKSGWAGFFRTLKHGLERHPGASAVNLSFMQVAPGASAADVFRRLTTEAEIAAAGPGGTYQGVLPALNDALITIMVTQNESAAAIYVGLVVYDLPEARIEEIRAEWQGRVTA